MCVRVHVCGWVMESSETNEEVEKGVPSGKGSVSGLYVCRETANKDNTGDPPPPKKKKGVGGGCQQTQLMILRRPSKRQTTKNLHK